MNEKYDIAFVGSFVSDDNFTYYTGASFAGNNYQGSFLRQLQNFSNVNNFVVLPFSVFPRNRFLFIGKKNAIVARCIDVYVNYINIIFLKNISIYLSLFFLLLKWLNEGNRNKKIVILFNPDSYHLVPISFFRFVFRVRTVLIIADLEPYPRKISFRWLEFIIQQVLVPRFTNFIALSAFTIKKFKYAKHSLLIEGGVPDDYKTMLSRKLDISFSKSNNIVISYAGALDANSYIEHLIKAFKLINNPIYKLHIYGRGDKEGIVRKYVKNHKGIIYFGYVNNQEAINNLQSSSVVVIPRLPLKDNVKYNFPSKVFEYLSTGTPVIMHKLPSIPSEYYNFINAPLGYSEMALCEKIIQVTSYFSISSNLREYLCRLESFLQKKTWNSHEKSLERYLNQEIQCDWKHNL